MYLPGYNSVLVPASSDQVSMFDSSYHTLQPPRRRRPLLTILKLLQGGRLVLNADGEVVEISDKPDTFAPRDGSSAFGNFDRVVPNSNKRDELLSRVFSLGNSNYGRFLPGQNFAARYVKVPLEDLPNKSETSDLDDGFSYMYKYSSPKSRSSDGNENVEVSLQRGKHRAYPHDVNRESFEGVRDTIALKLIKPQVPIDRSNAVFRQSIKQQQQHENYDIVNENKDIEDKEEEIKKGNSTVVITNVSRDGNKPTRLVLKPSAKAVAGAKGVAIAAPVARAVIKKGQKVSLEFDPDAVAIAGPGGRAHAHPEFIIDYVEDEADLTGSELLKKSNNYLEPRAHQAGVQSLAYYGGARGKFLIIHPSGNAYISSKPATKSKEEEDEDVGMEESGNEENDSVAISTPPENASVAEAKPVGLAVAGPGGVASSKPVATAVVGPGGLAIARPVATAIAGVQGTGPLIGLTPGGKLGNLQKQIFWNAGKDRIVPQGSSNDIYNLYPISIY